MKLKSIAFSNYKAFKSKQILEIKPVTLLIGKNSAGKSVVARLPLLLQKALLPTATSPIELEFDEIEFGGSFKDLIHNRIDHGRISFDLFFEDQAQNSVTLKVTIQNIADTPMQVISKFEIINSNGVHLEINWDLDSDVYTSPQYPQKEFIADFQGIYLKNLKHKENPQVVFELQEELNNIYESIQTSIQQVNYLKPFRDLPKRNYKYPGGSPTTVGNKGEYAAQVLGMDKFTQNGIIEQVGNWFENNLGGWRLDVEGVGEQFKIVLVSPENPSVAINLTDVGHGMSQVLPLVVNSFLEHTNYQKIEIIEQPELHLHPAAHSSLAELLTNQAQNNASNTSLVLETHSEILILRIRRLVAEKKLAPEDVIIYWVDNEETPGSSKIKPIHIDEEGEVDNWPEDVFSEDYNEVVALQKVQNQL